MKSELTRELVEKALQRLGELAAADGIQLEMALYGGGAMMLAYDRRVITKDVDAVVIPSKVAVGYIKQVARELSLHEKWLNDDVRVYLGTRGRTRPLKGFSDNPGLRIHVATAGYLLAMKALACREPLPGYEGDLMDLEWLIRKMDIRSVKEIQKYIDQYYEHDAIAWDKVKILQQIIARVRQGKKEK
jgi:hypothetical protein